jgi:hypothetical protein
MTTDAERGAFRAAVSTVKLALAVSCSIALMFMSGLGAYWVYFDDAPVWEFGGTPEVLNHDFQPQTVFEPSDSLFVHRDMKRLRDDCIIKVRRALVDGTVRYLPNRGAVMKKGQLELTVPLVLPPDLHPGQWIYRVWADVSCNVFHREEVPFPDAKFSIVWGERTRAEQRALLK